MLTYWVDAEESVEVNDPSSDEETKNAKQRIEDIINELSLCATDENKTPLKSQSEAEIQMKVWKVDDVKFSTRRKTNMGVKSAYNNTASFKYWEKDPRILAVGTSLTDHWSETSP